jgi:hypothetical protein
MPDMRAMHRRKGILNGFPVDFNGHEKRRIVDPVPISCRA